MNARMSTGLAVIAMLLAVIPLQAQVLYTITDLGSLPGFNATGSAAYAINNSGQVAGADARTTIPPTLPAVRAWRYTPGVGLIDLGTLQGPTGVSVSVAINGTGQVAGNSGTMVTSDLAFRYSDGVGIISLGTLPGHVRSTTGGINNTGQVVGTSTSGALTANRAFRFTDGVGMVDLGVPPGASNSNGADINNIGQVAISALLLSGSEARAFRYSDATGFLDLGTFGGAITQARGINDSGQVVGYSDVNTGVSHAFRYTDGAGLLDLGTLPGGTSSGAAAINALGDVVGSSNNAAGQSRAFVYKDGIGMVDLNGLIDPGSGSTLFQGWGINDLGQIVGEGTIGGMGHAYLLTPVPEPSSLFVISTIVTVIVGRRVVRRFPSIV